MNHNYNFAFIAIVGVLSTLAVKVVDAQAPAQAGLVLVNATGLKEKLQLSADGKNLLGDGLDSGSATSGIPLSVGPHQLQVSVQRLDPVKLPVTITIGASPIFVAYVEDLVDPRTRVGKKFLRVVPIMQHPQTNKYLTTLVSLTPTPMVLQVNRQAVSLEYKKPYPVEGRKLLITDAGKDVFDTDYSEKSSQFCFLFRGSNNQVSAILVPDMVYTW